MVISIRKTIPTSSDYYSNGGDTTIILAGTYSIIPHFKKDLIKIRRPKAKSRQASSPSDKFDNSIVDLKKGTDEIVVRGWLEDEIYGGTASSGGATTLTDNTQSWTIDQYIGFQLSIISGAGAGESKSVISNTSDTLTVDSAWSVNPNATSVYSLSITAWEKLWKIRAMCSTGGALTNFTMDSIVFSSSTQEAFLEELTGTIKSDDTGEIHISAGEDVARIDISLNIFIGDAR